MNGTGPGGRYRLGDPGYPGPQPLTAEERARIFPPGWKSRAVAKQRRRGRETFQGYDLGELTALALERPHSAWVIHPDGRPKRVKNLGYVLKNWKEVDTMLVAPVSGPVRDWAAVMFVALRDGSIYATAWADLSIIRDWLDRPVFRGLRVRWGGRTYKVGGELWRAMEV